MLKNKFVHALLFLAYLFSSQNSWAQVTETQIREQINTLETLITRAENLNIETIDEKMSIRIAEAFIIFAEWDDNNKAFNKKEFTDHKALPLNVPPMSPTELAELLGGFERSEVLILLNDNIDRLTKIISGELSRKPTFNPDWNSFEYTDSRLEQDGKPVFAYSWNFLKGNIKGVNIGEYLGKISGYFFHPNYLIRSQTTGNIVMVHWAADQLRAKDKSVIGVPFLGQNSLNGFIVSEFPEITQGSNSNIGFDIDHPQARVLHEALLEKVVPELKGTKLSKLGYLLNNEPHFNWSGTWDTMEMSDLTRLKFKDWLQSKHQSIVALNSAWGTSFNSFQQAINSVVIPVQLSARGPGKWYDIMKFNQERVTEWFTFLHETIKKHDNEAKTFIKHIPFWASNVRHEGTDAEALTELTDIIGNDAHTEHDLLWGTKPWQKDYNMGWQSMASIYDFYRSVAPNKVNYNSETHSLWTPVSHNLFEGPDYPKASHWVATLHGCDLNASWIFARKSDGSSDDSVIFSATGGQQPRVLNALHSNVLDQNRYAEEISLIQDEKMPIRLFYSKTSAINKSNHMSELKKIYEELYFEGHQLGFVTENIIRKQDNKKWEVLVINRTEFVTTSELEAIQDYLNNGGTVIKDGSSLLKDEYGKSHSITLNPGSGSLITTSNSDIATRALTTIRNKEIFPVVKVKDALISKVMSRSTKTTDGRNVTSLVHLGLEDTEVNLSLGKSTEDVVIIDLLKGVELKNGFIMKPQEVLLLEVSSKKDSPVSSGQFDFGTTVSPVENNYIRVYPKTTPTTTGYFGWNETTNINARDRKLPSGIVSDLNRDFIFGTEPRQFEVNVINGTYNVTVTLGDIRAHDDMVIKAEGVVINDNIDRDINQFEDETFTINVVDNKLSLEFSDAGGNDPNWVVNRVVFNNIDASGVTLYTDCDYQGTSATFKEGIYGFSEFIQKFPNDELSSIIIPECFEVTLYEHDYPDGLSRELSNNDACLANNNFDNKTSSIEVKKINNSTCSTLNTSDSDTSLEHPIIYPNPADNVLNVEFKKPLTISVDYKITNMVGQKVLEGNLKDLENNIAIHSLENGMYFLNLVYSNDVIISKFLISK